MACASCGWEEAQGRFRGRRGAALASLKETATEAVEAAAAAVNPTLSPAPAPAAAHPMPPPTYGVSAAPGRYAGFWVRFLAVLADSIIPIIFMTVVAIPLGLVSSAGSLLALAGDLSGQDTSGIQLLGGLLGTLVGWLSSFVVWRLYEAFMTSSSKQATLGKIALGIKVTDEAGHRLSFGRATGRHFAKYLSGTFLMFGYLMQPFTSRRQALHDLIVHTVAVRT